jgi:exodeoxyribonuclease VII large subunit
MKMLIDKETALSVSELNNLIKDVVNMGFPNAVWVCGEIQGFDRNRDKKHIFFDLCEKNTISQDIVARIGLVLFSSRKPFLDDVLKETQNAFELKDDIEVKFLCRVDFYPPHGALRLVVESIDPIYTLGKIAQEKQKLIALLKQRGTLDKNKALLFPLVPLNIGVITAYDSAAYNDFIAELRASGFAFKVFCRKTIMQGKNTPPDVCRAIAQLNRREDLDAIVITRGGGSIADLSCFDNEMIAEAIAQSDLPVLSGIGHEINITITDLAAHTYQKTPTAIAQFLVAAVKSFMTGMEERVVQIMDRTQDIVGDQKKSLHNRAFDLHRHTTVFLKSHHQSLDRCLETIKRQPFKRLKDDTGILRNLKETLFKAAKARLRDWDEKCKHYQRIVDIADPKNILRRGFSITRTADGRVVRKVKDVETKDLIITQLVDGKIRSQVGGVKKEE